MSDVLLRPNFGYRFGYQSAFPKENYLASPDALKEMLLNIGFRYVRVEDSSEQGHKRFRRYLCERLERDPRVDPAAAMKTLKEIERDFDDHIASCMVYAIK